MATCNDEVYEKAKVGQRMCGGVRDFKPPTCHKCSKTMELCAPDNRVVCPSCKECITCSCKGYTEAHEKKAQELLEKIAAAEKATEELERASVELSTVTAELKATRNILNEGINHDAALRARELTYKQHLLGEKVREGREQVDETERLRQFAYRLNEVRAGRPIVLCERWESSFLGFIMEGRTSSNEQRRCLKCICGNVRFIDGQRMDNMHAGSHAVFSKIQRPASFDLYVYLENMAGMTDQHIQRLLDRTNIDAENSSDINVLQSWLNRPICINKHLINMRENLQLEKQRIDFAVERRAQRAAVQLARTDLLVQRVTLKEEEKNSVEKAAITAGILQTYMQSAAKFQFFRDNLHDYTIAFHSIKMMNSALLFSSFVMANDGGMYINEATADLLECFHQQCLNWPCINEQDIQRSLSRENAQDTMLQHMLFVKHPCVLIRGNSECTIRYTVKEAAEFAFNPRSGIDVSKWGIYVTNIDVLVITAGRQIFFKDGRVQFTGDHTAPMQASFVLEVSTAPADPAAVHCVSFDVIIQNGKGFCFCPELVFSGTHTEKVASCRTFTLPKRLAPENFKDMLTDLPLRATSFGTMWHVEYEGESKQAFEEKQVYLKLEERIQHDSKLLFHCAASVPERDDLSEVSDDTLRAKMLAIQEDGRLRVMKVRNGISRYYYELATEKPLFRKTGSWDSESARMFLREKIASLPDFKSGMAHFEIDLKNSTFLHVTVCSGLVISATISMLSFGGKGLLPIGNAIIARKYFNGVPILAYINAISDSYLAFMNLKHWRVCGEAYELPNICIGSAFLKTHKQQIDGTMRLLCYADRSRGVYVEYCGKAYRLIGEEGVANVLRAQLHRGQATVESVSAIMKDVLQHNAVQFKSTFTTDTEREKNNLRTERMRKFKEGFREDFCKHWKGKVRAKWAKSALTISLPQVTFSECSLKDAATMDRLKAIVGHLPVSVFVDGEYVQDEFFLSALTRKSVFSHDGAGIPLPGFNDELNFTGTVKTDHRAPQSPLGFHEVWQGSTFAGYEFSKRYFISCDKSSLRQCDAIILQLLGYTYRGIGEDGWSGSGLYFQKAYNRWQLLNIVHKSIEKLPFSRSVIANVDKMYTISAFRYEFRVSSMNTAEMENIAHSDAVKRMMRAFAPHCSKHALLERASLFEASSNGKWWPIIVPFLTSISSRIAAHCDVTMQSFRSQRRLKRCTLERETVEEAAQGTLTVSEISKRDEKEDSELNAIWEKHIYS